VIGIPLISFLCRSTYLARDEDASASLERGRQFWMGIGMNNRECPACRVRLEDGFMMDRGDRDRVKPATGVEGEPEKSFWSGTKTKGKRQLPVAALRCPRCGRIELYTAERGE
jgi:hypothetical protein